MKKSLFEIWEKSIILKFCRFCGRNGPPPIIATQLRVTFWSNYRINDRGFLCAVGAFDPATIPGTGTGTQLTTTVPTTSSSCSK